MKFWFSRRLGNLMLQQEADLGKLRSEASYFCSPWGCGMLA